MGDTLVLATLRWELSADAEGLRQSELDFDAAGIEERPSSELQRVGRCRTLFSRQSLDSGLL